ncbi:MAG: beta-lactamase family protein [Polyangiaceae bacterium]|nr:beta-lactamase family protein [Polyangiaceae bacterium]
MQTRTDDGSPPLIDLCPAAALVIEAHRAAPCACVAAAIRDRGAGGGRSRFRYGLGAAGRLWLEGSAPPGAPAAAPAATPATIFDLASVTKPLTALALARLERAGLLRRDEPLGEVLVELAATRSGRVPLDLLASHRAGLDGHRPLYAPLLEGRRADVAESLGIAADARREGCDGDPPAEGFPPVYSDLGYLLLGAAIARRGGADLDEVVAREVTRPLGLWGDSAGSAGGIASARQHRQRDPGFDDRVAPTEVVALRGGVVRGAVHDENAWALAGDGLAGHAGLFGDAAAVARLGVALLEALAGARPEWLTPAEIAPLVRPRAGGSLLAGFDSKSGPTPSSGSRFGARTFGHLGFTGTSLWIDPEAELVGVLLTNRVHPTRDTPEGIRSARPAAFDAIAEAMRRG